MKPFTLRGAIVMPRFSVLPLVLPEIKELLAARNLESLRQLLVDLDPVDLADGWRALSPAEQVVVFQLLPRRLQSLLFEELDVEEQRSLLLNLEESNIKTLLADLDPSTTSRLVRRLSPRMMRHFLELMKREEAGQVEEHLNFPVHSVGSLMRRRFVTVNQAWTVHRSLEHIRANTRLRHLEELYLETIYVRDNGQLVGTVALQCLVVAPSEMQVGQLMDRQIQKLSPMMDQEEAAAVFRKYKLSSAPVVDANGGMIGIVVVGDVLKVIERETEEDFAKMAGMGVEHLLTSPPLYIARVRFPWLIATCCGYFFVGWMVKHYEGTLAQVIGLASFMPLIAAMGGNVGSQTATAVVRGLATGEVRSLGVTELVIKETSVGALLGLIYGLGAAAGAHLLYGDRFGWRFSLVVGSGMFASMTAASLMGSLEPFIFQKLRIDPATATGPLITFFADLVSTATYLTVATWLFLQ